MRSRPEIEPRRGLTVTVAANAVVAFALVACLAGWTVARIACAISGGQAPGILAAGLTAVRYWLRAPFRSPATVWPTSNPPTTIAWLLGWTMAASLLWLAWRVHRARLRASAGMLASGSLKQRVVDWARPADLMALVSAPRNGGQVPLGEIRSSRPRERRRLWAPAQHHVALIAPTGAGKTVSIVIPAVLEWGPHPLVVTSTKRDVFDATAGARAQLGDVRVWDPLGTCGSHGWTPLDGCEDWQWALLTAGWLADALGGTPGAERFWDEQGKSLLAPLLHAAALRDGGMRDVLDWLSGLLQVTVAGGQLTDPMAPVGTGGCPAIVQQLRDVGADPDADRQIRGVLALDHRTLSSVTATASGYLAAHRLPDVQATDRAEITSAWLFEPDTARTLFIVVPDGFERALEPLVVCLLAGFFQRLAGRADTSEPVLFALDEVANISGMEALPRRLATARGSGGRILTVFQDQAQLKARWKNLASSIVGNSATKLWLGPVSDHETMAQLQHLTGETWVQSESAQRSRVGTGTGASSQLQRHHRVDTTALQRLPQGEGILVSGGLPPAHINVQPFYTDERLSRLSKLPPPEVPAPAIPDREPLPWGRASEDDNSPAEAIEF